MAAKRTPSSSPSNEPSFEQALAELEAIVEAMEQDNLPLEDLVTQYEKGSKLLARCDAHLRAAKERLELITLRQEEIASQAMENLDAGPQTGHDASADSDDDDIRLF